MTKWKEPNTIPRLIGHEIAPALDGADLNCTAGQVFDELFERGYATGLQLHATVEEVWAVVAGLDEAE